MRNNNMEIRIAGSSCRPQFLTQVDEKNQVDVLPLNPYLFVYLFDYSLFVCLFVYLHMSDHNTSLVGHTKGILPFN